MYSSSSRINYTLTESDQDLIHVIKRHIALAEERTDFMRDIHRLIDRYERKTNSPYRDTANLSASY